MDRNAVITCVVGGVILAALTGLWAWMQDRDDIATEAETVRLIEEAIAGQLAAERQRVALQNEAVIARLDASEQSRQEFRQEVHRAMDDLRASQQQMLSALITGLGGSND